MKLAFLARDVQCEMCGTTVPRTRRILVDRTVLQVGPECERFGRVLDTPAKKAAAVVPGNVPAALEKRKRQQPKDVFAAAAMQLELVEDFAARIKSAREKKGWTRQDLGSRVGEREVVIQRFENGSLHPPDDVARRIERELTIRLFEPVQQGTTKTTPSRGMTLGDMLRDLERKKDE